MVTWINVHKKQITQLLPWKPLTSAGGRDDVEVVKGDEAATSVGLKVDGQGVGVVCVIADLSLQESVGLWVHTVELPDDVGRRHCAHGVGLEKGQSEKSTSKSFAWYLVKSIGNEMIEVQFSAAAS